MEILPCLAYWLCFVVFKLMDDFLPLSLILDKLYSYQLNRKIFKTYQSNRKLFKTTVYFSPLGKRWWQAALKRSWLSIFFHLLQERKKTFLIRRSGWNLIGPLGEGFAPPAFSLRSRNELLSPMNWLYNLWWTNSFIEYGRHDCQGPQRTFKASFL